MKSGGESDTSTKHELVCLDLATGEVTSILQNARELVSLTGNKLIFTSPSSNPSNYNPCTNILNLDTLAVTEMGNKKLNIEGFIDRYVVYTRIAPNEFNRNLYIKALDEDAPEQLVEKNIFRFCDIIADKLFYYVGNSRNQSLININCDGTERREWPLFISKVLFEQGGWLYFIRSAGYNSILCKSRLDGSKFSIIAADIGNFIKIQNGYLYYINDNSTLVKVRMDGSNLQTLCDDVQTVLSVKEDKIIFVSVDDRAKTGALDFQAAKIIKSIYAVVFAGTGKIKLAYNIEEASEYDENTVCYTAQKPQSSTSSDSSLYALYKLDVPSNESQEVLEWTEVIESKGCYIATCVYGSYNCPEVWTLRRFRDFWLDRSFLGRAFIKVYYAVSPKLVKTFGHCGWFTVTWRAALNKMVQFLQERGYEDTPYND